MNIDADARSEVKAKNANKVSFFMNGCEHKVNG
jgi:hypothetical protein